MIRASSVIVGLWVMFLCGYLATAAQSEPTSIRSAWGDARAADRNLHNLDLTGPGLLGTTLTTDSFTFAGEEFTAVKEKSVKRVADPKTCLLRLRTADGQRVNRKVLEHNGFVYSIGGNHYQADSGLFVCRKGMHFAVGLDPDYPSQEDVRKQASIAPSSPNRRFLLVELHSYISDSIEGEVAYYTSFTVIDMRAALQSSSSPKRDVVLNGLRFVSLDNCSRLRLSYLRSGVRIADSVQLFHPSGCEMGSK